MLTLPDAIVAVLMPFATLFSKPTWRKAQLLLVGAILTTGQRTVAQALRVMGRSQDHDYARYHEVLNRAVWSPRRSAGILLGLLLQHLAPGHGPLVFGIDETLERRRGPRIEAKGTYRDAARSHRGHVVKASGLRWISLMWLGQIPWAHRVWALPLLTVLAPSEPYYRTRGRQPKKLTDWARQLILQLRRWLPDRDLVVVGDGAYAALDLLQCCRSLTQPVSFITRLRLDARLYHPPPARQPRQRGRSRIIGPRQTPLAQLLHHPNTSWTAASVAWYGGHARTVALTSHTALWYVSGKPPVPIRWVLIRDPPIPVPTPGPALHRPQRRSRPDHPMVCAALATGSNLPRSPHPPGCGDPTPMVPPGHRPHHANPAGPLLLGNPGRPPTAKIGTHALSDRSLVPQTQAHFHRRPGPGALPPVASHREFCHVARTFPHG